MTQTITDRSNSIETAEPEPRKPGRARQAVATGFAAALITATALLAYRAVNGPAPSQPAPIDTSFEQAERQRMLNLGPAAPNGDDTSFEQAEQQRMLNLDQPTPDDGSHDNAERQRMQQLATDNE